MAGNQRAIRDRTGTDGEVDVLRDQILRLFRNADLDLQLRVALQQPGDTRNDLQTRHRCRRSDTDGAGRRGSTLPEDLLGLIHRIQHAAGMSQKIQPILRKGEAARRTLDQPDLEMRLKRRDLA